jgi:hypothetical protein
MMRTAALVVGERRVYLAKLAKSGLGEWRRTGGTWALAGEGVVSLEADDDVAVVKALSPGVAKLRYSYPKAAGGTWTGSSWATVTATIIEELQITVVRDDQEFDFIELEDITRAHVLRSSWRPPAAKGEAAERDTP